MGVGGPKEEHSLVPGDSQLVEGQEQETRVASKGCPRDRFRPDARRPLSVDVPCHLEHKAGKQ